MLNKSGTKFRIINNDDSSESESELRLKYPHENLEMLQLVSLLLAVCFEPFVKRSLSCDSATTIPDACQNSNRPEEKCLNEPDQDLWPENNIAVLLLGIECKEYNSKKRKTER